jgi:hypothetical protein
MAITPPSSSCFFSDVVLVPFPFTDQSGVEKRPAVISFQKHLCHLASHGEHCLDRAVKVKLHKFLCA